MYQTKVCSGCHQEYFIEEFEGFKTCSTCRNRESIRNYSYTGQAERMFRHQKGNSNQRGHQPPTYTKKEFVTWCISNPKYIQLHDEWSASGYKVQLVPSADRLDDSKGYSLGNIQIMTWQDNRLKGTRGRSDGPTDPRVNQFTKEGEYIATYLNAASAAKVLNKNARSNIVHACAGRNKSAYGYVWKYSE